ncbi:MULTISPECIES: nucleotidyltransferase family protein [unclassified Modestobacter]
MALPGWGWGSDEGPSCPPALARSGRGPARGPVRDADLFCFDPDTSWAGEDAVIRRGAELFADLPVPVEIRNEARVHLWYADKFGGPAPAPFRSCTDAIDAFAAVCCMVGVTVGRDGGLRVHAPSGWDDLFGMVVRPNPRLAPPHVYETKAARWASEWPQLTVLPWNAGGGRRAGG